ncbi:putative urocanate hydratase [Phytophthora fragariae]|uniref:urocanate hydratase n=1 Tax=Phytophthora fragariae TaxID=53985 RepID=A0A6A3T4C7_9STRA|nr:putative urocanate hydratase [Phytophthora fragariae]KAE8931743.1 putative urocanate hydratase [Phytophthora fragariae]KAE9096059.1 putative urocanate hydratase [Phytophthora fragariae]KAE9096111.1 putative urocanate hydratase [Phytophthora fragariae]KAE9129324.1 putative urocanate hydratase [Phytophthora fragariae]
MASSPSVDLSILRVGIPAELPPHPGNHPDPTVPKAPHRNIDGLSKDELVLAVQNALRYFPEKFHATLAPEFAQELKDEGHIYMHRFRPVQYEVKAYPIELYPAQCKQAASIMLMIMNNLDRRVAQFPNHLVTYGGNGSVFQNWAQYLLAMRYLSELTEQQTLVMYSGHPMGLFPSRPAAPRMVVTNGLMIPNYSTRAQYDKAYAMGNTQYGQMTAGSYCYIGPQGIVHGTTITVLNACRKYLQREDTRGTVYVSSGLGGMSGAQPKAGVISGVISVTAEIDESAVKKRHEQGWVDEVLSDLGACVARIREAKEKGEVVSLAYHGNVVTLWERLADEAEATGELLVELGSDQTSLHNPFNGGYYPVQLSFEESQRVMAEDPARFQELVQESLRRHAVAVNRLTAKGMRFWDYGNSFLLEAQRAGADVLRPGVKPEEAAVSTMAFKYPSYVQDIMGDIFSLGFGPFRWVCTSGKHEDLMKTDEIAARVLRDLLAEPEVPDRVAAQLRDNLRWIEAAEENKLVVGSEARILYADRVGRGTVAMALNAAVASGEISAPVVLSRDHHDVSGTDSPFRETSNVTDGSAFCADMAVQNALGDAARGATWIALHNGGGVGWGEVMNGGFGMVLDGSEDAREKAACMLGWDVNNGVARRAWARNANARFVIEREMKADPLLTVTLANEADDASVRDAVSKLF